MPKLSRRNFLTSSAAVGLAAAMPAAEAAITASEKSARHSAEYAASGDAAARFQALDELGAPDLKLSNTFSLGNSTIDEGVVMTANRWGVARAHVQGGKLSHLTPFEFDYAPSINLNGLAELPYNTARIRYPMVREGYLKNGSASRSQRGRDKWVRVSWEKALDLVAKDLAATYDKYGPAAVWGRSYGWMSTGKVQGSIPLLQRFLNLCGGFIQTKNSYSSAAISTILPYVVGSGDPRCTSWDNILKNSQRVVFWGCDPIVTNDIDWYTTIHNSAGYLRALKAKKDIKTIAINPLKPDTAAYLDSEWIAPRPGTDTAMMLGMICHLVDSGKADMAFLEKYTAGHKEFLAYVAGKSDGVKKTPEWAAEICGLPAAKIRELADELASHRTMIMMGWGIQRIDHGEQYHWMGYALAAVLGQIGLPGGGLGTNYQYSNGGSPAAFGPFLGSISSSVKPVREVKVPYPAGLAVPVASFVQCFLHGGKEIDFNGKHIKLPQVHFVFWAGGNPFAHHPQTNQVAEAFRAVDTVVVSDINWTATARHADIVLPACTTFETNDITNIGTYTNDGFVAMQQAIEPQWESRTNYWIFTELSKRMGVEKEFTEGRTADEWIEKLYTDAKKFGERVGIKMPEFADFWKKGYHMFDVKPEDRDYVMFGKFREDPKANALGTESGLIQLYSTKIASYKYDDCQGHPMYFKPAEGVLSATKEFPLALMSCKSRYRMHSQLDSTVSNRFADIQGREPCWINVDDAKALGIANGDIVLVESRRGAILAGAYVTDRVMKGVVVVHHGAWYSPMKVNGREIDIHGNSNTLTLDKPTSKLANGNIASTANVRVTKWTGEVPPVYTWFEPTFKAA